MRLTGKQIAQFIEDPFLNGKPQQAGYDLSLAHVNEICKSGQILKNESIIPGSKAVAFHPYGQKKGWYLEKGIYSLTFEQHISLPNNVCGEIVHRSSLLRAGCEITSGVFDPGFQSQIGATLFVKIPVFIEFGARVAQLKLEECYPVDKEDLYNGSYQGEKDRK